MKKTLLFITVIAVPVLIAVILKFFGQNEYVIPVYYQSGVTKSECGLNIDGQYYVEIDKLQETQSPQNSIRLFLLDDDQNIHLEYAITELDRVLTKTSIPLLNTYILSTKTSSIESIPGVEWIQLDPEILENIINCVLLVPVEENEESRESEMMVLIDKNNRIRGYFNCTDQEEYDRLSAELDILAGEKD